MVEHYLLPIAVLLETAKDLPEITSLRAQMPSVPGVWKEACVAEIILGCGHIHACTITTTPAGQLLLQQDAALHALEHLGELEWTLGPSFAAGPPLPHQKSLWLQQNPTPPQRDGTVPQRTDVFSRPTLLEGLPRRQKQVFLLADGQKQASDIARLLGLEPQEVEHLLCQLHHQHLIHYTTGEPS